MALDTFQAFVLCFPLSCSLQQQSWLSGCKSGSISSPVFMPLRWTSLVLKGQTLQELTLLFQLFCELGLDKHLQAGSLCRSRIFSPWEPRPLTECCLPSPASVLQSSSLWLPVYVRYGVIFGLQCTQIYICEVVPHSAMRQNINPLKG